MMKIAFALVAFAAIAAAVPSEFTEEAPVLDSSLLETEVHTDIAKMKKKGATEADCKDLAKTSCNEVLREVNTNQGLINKLKTGSQCIGRGQGGVTKMTLRWKKETKIHHSWTLKVKEVLRRKVTISAQRFSSLKRGHCGFIFSSRGYLSIHRSYKHAVSMELKYRGRVSEAWKGVLRARKTAARMVHECHCSTKSAEARLWRTVTSRTLIIKQNKAYTKCKMMTCVLNGTKLSSKSCKGKLPALRKKRLHRDTRRARCGRTVRPSRPQRRLGRL
jgi:hypothetical protein